MPAKSTPESVIAQFSAALEGYSHAYARVEMCDDENDATYQYWVNRCNSFHVALMEAFSVAVVRAHAAGL